ncbi:hypothetical protein HYH03_012331 [Edaphochlamys debaryana]|uniref:Embryonic stem cell-specific 5-hydroxymethylcytosine-binding protein n=1 Tax=Edaphochlamys debaryana TaxID=47281 RepID=A0A835XSY1_9CHLO|nr:hypothetical protein HYH03_012331 [Edaphochlamys debaryana]|eukprot:KAG2489105.1 hypothetical protein HYH03_012331 [Edaphochlamys debaryana]
MTTGLALGRAGACTPLQPLPSPRTAKLSDVARAVLAAAAQHRVEGVLVGIPLQPGGSIVKPHTDSPVGRRCRSLAHTLALMGKEQGLPVYLYSERGTTRAAVKALGGNWQDRFTKQERQARRVDSESAAMLLRLYFGDPRRAVRVVPQPVLIRKSEGRGEGGPKSGAGVGPEEGAKEAGKAGEAVEPGGTGFWLPVVVRGHNGERELRSMRWGLVPSFTRAGPGERLDHYKMFNARSETLTSKGVFSRLVPRRRCCVLLDGFYEWTTGAGGRKQPFHVTTTTTTADAPSPAATGKGGQGQAQGDGAFGSAMWVAGLYDTFQQDPDSEPLHTVTLITTDSSQPLGWLHDRMPVLLTTPQEVSAWLGEDEACGGPPPPLPPPLSPSQPSAGEEPVASAHGERSSAGAEAGGEPGAGSGRASSPAAGTQRERVPEGPRSPGDDADCGSPAGKGGGGEATGKAGGGGAGGDKWEEEKLRAAALVARLCRPYGGPLLRWHPVTPEMSKPSYDKPDACKDVRTKKGSIGAFFKPAPAAKTPTAASSAAAKKPTSPPSAAAAALPPKQDPAAVKQEAQAATMGKGPEPGSTEGAGPGPGSATAGSRAGAGVVPGPLNTDDCEGAGGALAGPSAAVVKSEAGGAGGGEGSGGSPQGGGKPVAWLKWPGKGAEPKPGPKAGAGSKKRAGAGSSPAGAKKGKRSLPQATARDLLQQSSVLPRNPAAAMLSRVAAVAGAAGVLARPGAGAASSLRLMATSDTIKGTVEKVAEKIHGATERAKEGLKSATDRASHTIDQVSGRAREGVDHTKDAASEYTERAKQTVNQYTSGARETLNDARDAAADAVGSARDSAKEAMANTKNTAREAASATEARMRNAAESAATAAMPPGGGGGPGSGAGAGSFTPTSSGGSGDTADALGSTSGTPGTDEAAKAAGRVVGETSAAFRSGREEGEQRGRQ